MERFIVTAEKLNVRQAPTINSDVVSLLSNGDVVDALKVSGDGMWVNFTRATGSKKQKGWASKKHLLSLDNDSLIQDDDLPWVKIAIREMGTREFFSSADNPRIVQYLQSTSNISNTSRSNDETYWCSAFVNWCVEKAGYEGTSSAWARHWLKWGRNIKEPQRGCIVVFKRGDGGHVGFYVRESKNYIYVLGGNQSDEVNIKKYSKKNLLGYRIMDL